MDDVGDTSTEVCWYFNLREKYKTNEKLVKRL